ncbi:uncharacterized protein TNCV_4553481 [Trichonephila clavipes]|nr:uncharacterized protein TNCV_4553481 [Trichonephila clavipes]
MVFDVVVVVSRTGYAVDEEDASKIDTLSEAVGTVSITELRVAGVSPLLSIGWWYLSSVSPKRHCCRVSAADKGCRVYPLNLHPDAVALYSGCTPDKHRAWVLPDDRHTVSLVELRGGWRHARTNLCTRTYGSNAAVPG